LGDPSTLDGKGGKGMEGRMGWEGREGEERGGEEEEISIHGLKLLAPPLWIKVLFFCIQNAL